MFSKIKNFLKISGSPSGTIGNGGLSNDDFKPSFTYRVTPETRDEFFTRKLIEVKNHADRLGLSGEADKAVEELLANSLLGAKEEYLLRAGWLIGYCEASDDYL